MTLVTCKQGGYGGSSQAAWFSADTCARSCSGGILSNCHQLPGGTFSPNRSYGLFPLRRPATNTCTFQYKRFSSSKPGVIRFSQRCSIRNPLLTPSTKL